MKYILNTSTNFLHIKDMCSHPFKYRKEFESEKAALAYQQKNKQPMYYCGDCNKKINEIVSDHLSKNK